MSGESEAAFTTRVIETAQWHGWRVAHFRPARTEAGWRTAMQGDKGVPDLILARAGVVVFAELKVGKGKPTPEQDAWLASIGRRAYVWRPSDWNDILAILSAPASAVPA